MLSLPFIIRIFDSQNFIYFHIKCYPLNTNNIFENLNDCLKIKSDFRVKSKDEIIPTHGTNVYGGGSRGIPPLILNFGTISQLHASSALTPKKEHVKYEAAGRAAADWTSPYPCQDSNTR